MANPEEQIRNQAEQSPLLFSRWKMMLKIEIDVTEFYQIIKIDYH